MEATYASVLMRLIETGMTPEQALSAVQKHLEEKGRIQLMPKLALALKRLQERDATRSTMTLSVGRANDSAQALREAERTLAEMRVTDTDLCETVDETLIGGWRLEGRGLLVDKSWKSSLLSLYNRATR
jgi:F0F1-type ATP synthase delta subunit